MRLLTALITRFRALAGRAPDADLGDELRFHVDMEAQNLEQRGLSATAARNEARRRLGGVDRYTEELRDVRAGRAWDNLRHDVRYALRIARRFPAFTAIVVGTLGIAIGANTAIFSVVDATLLRPLPFPDGDRLALLYSQSRDRSVQRFSASYADYLVWRVEAHSFSDMAAYMGATLTLLTDAEPLRLAGYAVTSNYFDVLGVRPLLGRVYRNGQSAADTADEIVLCYGFWQRQFAGDSSIVGRRLRIGDRARTVIGVLPASFDLDASTLDAVVILDPTTIPSVEDYGQHMISVIGRLKPGVTRDAAQADLSAVAVRLAERFPHSSGAVNVFMARDELTRDLREPLLVLVAAAGLVLLIGCINVANLLLTRGTLREREMALRQALGASRARLVSQLLVEGAELAVAGAVLGLIVARGALALIVRNAPAGLLPNHVGLDTRVLWYALGLAVVTTLGVALWPAVRATRPHLARQLRDGGRSASGGRRALRARRSLVVAETSLALVLLIGAGLVVQSLRHMLDVDPGFSVDNAVTMRVSLAAPRYTDTTQVQFFRDLHSRLEGRGGVEAVGAANTPPISGGGIITGISLIGMPRPAGAKLLAPVTALTPGYFRAMGMRLSRGRDVAWSDAKPTIVLSDAAATLYWPGQSPLGKRIGLGPDTAGFEVVGVVNDAHLRGVTADAPPMIYVSYAAATSVARSMSLVVRGHGGAAAITATTKHVIAEMDRTLPVFNVQAVTDLVDQSLGQSRLNTTLLTLFAAVALALAVIGIYGVISYSVTQRAQEIGVRMALGAEQGDVLRLVLREGIVLGVLGVAIGVGGALLLTPLIRSWLFGIDNNDPVTIATAATLLVVVALAASYMPARRAARVDPLVAMRAD